MPTAAKIKRPILPTPTHRVHRRSRHGAGSRRGAITGLGTFTGGILHTALITAVIVIAFELLALAWIRRRFFRTGFLNSCASIALGGAIIAGLSALLGST